VGLLYEYYHVWYLITERSRFLKLHAFYQPLFFNRHLHHHHHHYYHHHYHHHDRVFSSYRVRPSAVSYTSLPTVGEAKSTASSSLQAKPHYQSCKSEYVTVVRARMSELWERGLIQSFVPAHSESRLCATSKDISIATSLLPARPDLLLPAKPVSPLPAKTDPQLPACCQRGHICWYQRSQFHPYQWSRIHYYQLAPSEVRLSER